MKFIFVALLFLSSLAAVAQSDDDGSVLGHQYHIREFTLIYQSALYRKALNAQGIKYRFADVTTPVPFIGGLYENGLVNSMRVLIAAFNETVAPSSTQVDGHFAKDGNGLTGDGRTVWCTVIISRKEFAPHVVSVRSSPCIAWDSTLSPDTKDLESSRIAIQFNFVGYLNLKTDKYCRDPQYPYGKGANCTPEDLD